jgi:hypothetical protein
VEAKLKAGQMLFVLPRGRLPVKAVSSEAGVKQLLKIALLQDVADRAGAVFAASPADGDGDAAGEAESTPSAARAAVAVGSAAAPVAAAAAPPPPPPTSPPAPSRPQPPPPQQQAAASTPPAVAAADDDEEDDEQPFAPVFAGQPSALDPDAERRLMSEYYALEQQAAADRVANVASAARAQIDDAMQEAAAKVDQVDRSIDEEGGDRSIDSAEKNRSIDRSSSTAASKRKGDDDDDDDDDDEAKSTVVSKGLRKKRPGEAPPPKLAPEQLQRSVLAALKEVDPSRDERDKNPDARAAKPLIGDDGEDAAAASLWWKKRFRALYLPTVHTGGAVGFLQVDISSDGTAKDVRVIAFEDRYDAMACVATMAEIASFQGSTFSVGALPTEKVEQELRDAYLRQKAEGGTASAPSGVLVFRRGKLPLRVGMTEEEFVRVLVLQGTAQTSLLSSGFQF